MGGAFMNNKIRVLLVDDHPIIRQGIHRLLDHIPDIEVVGEAQNGAEALSLCHELHPDVALIDIVMPEMNGVELARQINNQNLQVYIVALTSVVEEQIILDMIRVGASGYLLKDAPLERIAQIIRLVNEGYTILNNQIARKLALRAVRPTHPAAFDLTEREMEVLEKIAEGLSNAEVADTLVISRSTVKTHLISIFRKLDVKTRSEAVIFAQSQGLI